MMIGQMLEKANICASLLQHTLFITRENENYCWCQNHDSHETYNYVPGPYLVGLPELLKGWLDPWTQIFSLWNYEHLRIKKEVTKQNGKPWRICTVKTSRRFCTCCQESDVWENNDQEIRDQNIDFFILLALYIWQCHGIVHSMSPCSVTYTLCSKPHLTD